MKLELFNRIMGEIHLLPRGTRDVVQSLSAKFPNVSTRTLGSINAQEYQRKMKRSHYRHTSSEVVQSYYDRFLEARMCQQPRGILLRLSEEVDLSPSLFARIILEQYTTKHSPTEVTKQQISRLLKDTALIEDGQLALEIYLCVLNDDNYGPLADTIKHSIGHEYECKLRKLLEENGITFIEEEQMRAKGYDKTPDFKLEVPIAINGFIVNWIESKASFGDEDSHRNYLKDQFWSYWNRFGSGMVIYWFGYIEELDTNRGKGIMLQESFPIADITLMNPSSAYTKGEFSP